MEVKDVKVDNDQLAFLINTAIQNIIKVKNVDPKRDGQDFANLKTLKGSLFEATVKGISEIIDVISMMKVMGIDPTYEYLRTIVIPKINEYYLVGKTAWYSLITFESPLLAQMKRHNEALLILSEDKGPLTDAASCRSCGAPKVHRKVAQTRSADEGATSIFTCPNCASTWTEN